MKLFRTKEEYDLAIENLRKAEGVRLPQPQYPKEFPAILVVDVKFHRMHQSFQAWVYLSDFRECNNKE